MIVAAAAADRFQNQISPLKTVISQAPSGAEHQQAWCLTVCQHLLQLSKPDRAVAVSCSGNDRPDRPVEACLKIAPRCFERIADANNAERFAPIEREWSGQFTQLSKLQQTLAQEAKAAIAVEKATGAQWAYIPYKGGSQALQDTIAGQTQMVMNGMLATLPHVQSGKLKVLGVSKATRVALLPHVPTIAEQGLKGFESGTWQGVMVPAAMPAAAVQKLHAELTRIIRSPEVRERLVAQGAEVHTMTSADTAAFFEKERKHWAQVVAQGGVKAD